MLSSKLMRCCMRSCYAKSTILSLPRHFSNVKILRLSSAAPVRNSQILSFNKTYSTDTHTDNSNFDDDAAENDNIKDEENHEKSEDEIRIQILENALNHVHTHGWSREALALGAEDAGYSSVAEGMFHSGGADLVLYLVKSNNENFVQYMEDICNNSEGEKMKINAFIRDALEHRLRMIIPYIDVWSEAMAILLQPPVIMEATQELGNMVDDIWFYAGDTATDFNWYTKRGLLAKLFVSTQTVMIKDQSPDFADSWEFLDRRMNDIAAFGKVSRTIQQQGKMAADVAFAGFTVLRNVAGLGERRR